MLYVMTIIFDVQKLNVISDYVVPHLHQHLSVSSPLAPNAREIQNLVLRRFGQLLIASPCENANNE